ncbi:flagellar basal-body rod protein FlgF [Ferrimonas balearica]|uniref:flagellar basal-body rod protein FlgF n=1 Tax=Ferrimonas balearica TaxID=44012 RepID=UPI001C9A1B59|nr:flagellar basal-body rod protein FlgF [Ferrimonas balearica]MBY5991978.1 flagellar basal-body rod protein FlgF [Ferrimonas balearica]
MDKLLYTAASGASRVMEAQTIRANNLANVNTNGFRADLERVQAHQLGGSGLQTRVLAQTQQSGANLRAGELNNTGRTLDVAIQGDGWLTVQTPEGEAYTRAGGMVLDADGFVTIDGRAVLGLDGPIQLPEYRELTIGEDGTLSLLPAEGGLIEEVGQLKLVNPEANQLVKGTDGLMRLDNGAVAPQDEEVKLASGFLEGSNVTAIEELLASMSLSRQFELQVKLMKSAETLAQSGNRLLRDS